MPGMFSGRPVEHLPDRLRSAGGRADRNDGGAARARENAAGTAGVEGDNCGLARPTRALAAARTFCGRSCLNSPTE